jgi:hypothetical protein
MFVKKEYTKLKTETIEEFIARGGIIKRIPFKHSEKKSDITRKTEAGPAIILSYEEADLFYGEGKPHKVKTSKLTPSIDLNSLPEALRIKYINKLKANQDEE